MRYQYDDGGRSAAGYKGKSGDCCARAFAIASGKPYREIYELINSMAACERTGRKKRGTSSARNGVYRLTAKKLAEHLGAKWVPTMQIGSGCRVHLRDGELPMGRLVVNLSRHFSAVIDGVLHDTYDGSRGGTRCVYGYWVFP
jgi:hypothetical protein